MNIKKAYHYSISMRCIMFFFISVSVVSCNSHLKDRSFKNGYAEVNGTKLYYEIIGEGDAIVLVHGNFGDRRHWDYQFATLSKNHKIIRYDIRGYGKSATPKSEEAYTDNEDLKSLLGFLKIEKAHICGLSAGSSIAIDFALEYPDLCYSLVSIAPWVGGYGFGQYRTPNSDSLFAIFSTVVTTLKNKGTRAATDYWWTGDHSVRNTVKSGATLDSLLEMGYEYSYWAFLNENKKRTLSPPAIQRLNEIKIPTLIVTAEYDIDACKEVGDILKKNIANSTKISMNDAGHLMNMEKYDEFNRIILEFIGQVR